MLIQSVETLEVASKHRNEYDKLISSLISLSKSLTQHLQGSKSIGMSEFVNRITMSIQAQIDIINQKKSCGQGRHLIEAKREQEDVLSAYQEIQALLTQLQLHASMGIWNVIDQQHVDSRLHQMAPSKLAAYNSKLCDDINRRSCTKDTRVQVLAELSRWSLDSDAPNIYWMNGMAGTGKTTIAYTFAETLQANNSLGASFSCTRTEGECRDVAQIIPTIAYQLAHCSTHFRSALIRTLEADSDVTSRAISDQFRRLLVEPLMSVKDVIKARLVVIIDALDECSDPKGVEKILDVLLNTAARLPVKFFVTSRPDPLIQTRVNNQSDQTRSMLVLHEIEKSLVQSDIELYLREELAFMTISSDQLKQLTDRSGCLFIYAATAIRYIRAHGAFVDHEERLKNILDVSPSASRQHEEIDGLYMTVLERALENPILEETERERMRLALWTAVCTCQPVSIETLATLIAVNASKASIYLQSLFSVLHLSRASQTVSTLHASFPDFLFDKRRSGRFHCETSGHNQYLSERCFGIMKQQLRFNICGLKSSFLWDSEVPGLKDRIEQEVPSTLTYATHHWTDHVARSTSSDNEPEAGAEDRDSNAIFAEVMATVTDRRLSNRTMEAAE
ncbi:hypothetical protein BN14_09756 [Rhizoctonia solani AG-1 IB]|uniref:NACHT domain-containing protein n=1 Tax=Thanatephorus cucumeris (strain AG1-IB / isolate 7/3/14) TaxID=1108050 RepID=M5C6S9_THACB|nr:hypothetical protein BN14_09756 [Rhizoctonia solani AG-1 IB]